MRTYGGGDFSSVNRPVNGYNAHLFKEEYVDVFHTRRKRPDWNSGEEYPVASTTEGRRTTLMYSDPSNTVVFSTSLLMCVLIALFPAYNRIVKGML